MRDIKVANLVPHILGDSDFVNEGLESCRQQLERRYQFLAQGYDFNWLVNQVATVLSLEPEVVVRRGRYPDTAEARSVLCYWAARELGISTLELSKRPENLNAFNRMRRPNNFMERAGLFRADLESQTRKQSFRFLEVGAGRPPAPHEYVQ